SFFFFSSRRRHTRFSRDWSSDVCSSDLEDELAVQIHLGLCLGGLAHLDGPCRRDVGQGGLVEEIERLVVVLENVRLPALLTLLTLPGRCTAGVLVVRLVIFIRVTAVERLIVLILEL